MGARVVGRTRLLCRQISPGSGSCHSLKDRRPSARRLRWRSVAQPHLFLDISLCLAPSQELGIDFVFFLALCIWYLVSWAGAEIPVLAAWPTGVALKRRDKITDTHAPFFFFFFFLFCAQTECSSTLRVIMHSRANV